MCEGVSLSLYPLISFVAHEDGDRGAVEIPVPGALAAAAALAIVAWGVLERKNMKKQGKGLLLSECPYFAEILSEKLECNVSAMRDGRYAGALGAALLAREKTK